jgi:hypothetical protein
VVDCRGGGSVPQPAERGANRVSPWGAQAISHATWAAANLSPLPLTNPSRSSSAAILRSDRALPVLGDRRTSCLQQLPSAGAASVLALQGCTDCAQVLLDLQERELRPEDRRGDEEPDRDTDPAPKKDKAAAAVAHGGAPHPAHHCAEQHDEDGSNRAGGVEDADQKVLHGLALTPAAVGANPWPASTGRAARSGVGRHRGPRSCRSRTDCLVSGCG